ncbi:MAG TPA: DUF3987 domain-containing protein [Planctomycetaceae bacterium]|nr:DUF3987 domain-containing protein [Planctomycetaceae bacterium]
MLDAAIEYLNAGLCVLPAILEEKRPALPGWKQYQRRLPTERQVRAWFADGAPLCVLTGAVSGNLEMIDFDYGGELFDRWRELVATESPGLVERLVVERSQSGGRHVVYRSRETVPGNRRLALRTVVVAGPEPVVVAGKRHVPRRAGDRYEITCTLIETRGEGGLFLCAPTPGYAIQQGSFQSIPVLDPSERSVLIEAACALNETMPSAEPGSTGCFSGGRPGDEFNERGDVREVLRRHGWTLVREGDNEYWRRPGKDRGWSATLRDGVLYVFSSNAAPFEPDRAYSPFAVYALLEHGGDFAAAAAALRQEGYGRAEPAVDISAIAPEPQRDGPCVDPGPIPECLFEVPGFLRQVMDFTLSAAPYPNVALAFCGAMALQSFLAGRKVCTPGDLRTNIYLLALAGSGTGKEFPRKVNAQILFRVGLAGSLGDKFASGEGIQDALVRTGAMLFQNDEMDGVLRQINLDNENRRESIPNVLLTLYTSANDIYPIRVKAGQKETIHVDQPHVTLFGTATPQHFYESLSKRMLTNGFFARLSIIDVGRRGAGQTPGSARSVPDSVLEIAQWWADFRPGSGNLESFHPEPREVPFDPEAEEAVEQLRLLTEAEYDRAEAARDEVAQAAWSRTCENAKKLALIYACSENHIEPVIRLPAVEWATSLAMHQTRRQLYLAATYVAENPFHADCLKLLRKLREAPERTLPHSVLLKRMKMKAKDFRDLIETLVQRGEVRIVTTPRAGSPTVEYVLSER